MQVLRIITGNLLIVQKKPFWHQTDEADWRVVSMCVNRKRQQNKKEKTSNGQHAVEASRCKATEHLGRLPSLKAPQKKNTADVHHGEFSKQNETEIC